MSWISIKDSDFKILTPDQLLDKLYSDFEACMKYHAGNKTPVLEAIYKVGGVLRKHKNRIDKKRLKTSPADVKAWLHGIWDEKVRKAKEERDNRFKAAVQAALANKPTDNVVVIENDDWIEEEQEDFANKLGPVVNLFNFRNKLYQDVEECINAIINAKCLVIQTVFVNSWHQLESMLDILEIMQKYGRKVTIYIRAGSGFNKEMIRYTQQHFEHTRKGMDDAEKAQKRIENVVAYHEIYDMRIFDYDMHKKYPELNQRVTSIDWNQNPYS